MVLVRDVVYLSLLPYVMDHFTRKVATGSDKRLYALCLCSKWSRNMLYTGLCISTIGQMSGNSHTFACGVTSVAAASLCLLASSYGITLLFRRVVSQQQLANTEV